MARTTQVRRPAARRHVRGIGLEPARTRSTSGIIPRYKQYATITWTRGPWSATLGNPYQSSYIDVGDADRSLTAIDTSVASAAEPVGPVRRRTPGFKNWKLTLGVKNLFDEDPPFTNQQNTFQVGLRPVVLRCARALRVRLGDLLVQVDDRSTTRFGTSTGASGPLFFCDAPTIERTDAVVRCGSTLAISTIACQCRARGGVDA